MIFNRPEVTAVVFEKIKQQKPARLYIAADGARKNNEGENEKCESARQIVTNGIDWDCEVQTLFRNENLGCGKAVSQAISWFFEYEEEGIILEDDCLPSDSFFLFCTNMLERYRDNSKVMHIAGTNLNDATKFGNATYYFCNYPHVWGWATWRRAWCNYDFELKDTRLYTKLIHKLFKDPFEVRFWKTVLRTVSDIDTWDYQWMFSIWRANGICANTNYNFILNIGFDSDATHTTYQNPHTNLQKRHISNVIHPNCIEIDQDGDEAFLQIVHGLKRRGYWNYFLMRGHNLVHKIKLLINLQKR